MDLMVARPLSSGRCTSALEPARAGEGDKGVTSLSLPTTGAITPASLGTDCESQRPGPALEASGGAMGRGRAPVQVLVLVAPSFLADRNHAPHKAACQEVPCLRSERV